jgi:hypothetical protein
MMGRDRPALASMLAYVCRRSWSRTLSIAAAFHDFLISTRWPVPSRPGEYVWVHLAAEIGIGFHLG